MAQSSIPRRWPRPRQPWLILSLMLVALANTGAVSYEDLMRDQTMTPKNFAKTFEGFEYEFHEAVATPEVFLATRKGDCDDYAILADQVLRTRGFTTRLIHVRLVGQVAHVVCYVKEEQAYLDYNNRNYFFKLTRAKNRIRAIATKVADGLEANWVSVSEFTYNYETETKLITHTVAKQAPHEQDPDADDEHG